MRTRTLGVAVWLLVAALPAAAATITVDATADALADDGNCTLREAVRAANLDMAVDGCAAGSGTDDIVLPAGTFTLTLAGASEDLAATGDLDLDESATITGAGADETIVDAGDLDRAFDVRDGSVTFVGLTMRNGTAPPGEAGGVLRVQGGNTGILTDCVVADGTANDGGGIRVELGTLELLRTTVRDNTSTSSAAGIYALWSATTITDSTISGNVTANIGGGLFASGSGVTFPVTISGSTFTGNEAINGAAMFLGNDTQTTISNSTLSGNTATGTGGALYQSFGDGVTLANVTVAGNAADSGGGVAQGSSSAPIVLRNTIVADNTAMDGTSHDCAGAITSAGWNLVESTAGCTLTTTTGDVTGEDPDLLPLAENGGPTATHALDTDSPARNAGNPATPGSGGDACEATDQRGLERPGGSACDIGAVEQDSVPATTTTTTITTTTITTTTSSTTTTSTTSTTSTTIAGPTTTTSTSSTSTVAPPPSTSTTLQPPAPPRCQAPVAIDGVRLKLVKAGGTLGDERLQLRATLAFPAGVPAVFDPAASGMQVLIESLAGGPATKLWGLVVPTGPVPPGAPGTGCGAKDGWTKTRYRNASGAVPPSCAGGSAAGLQRVQLKDRRAKGKGVRVALATGATSIPLPAGALRVTVVLGLAGAAPCAAVALGDGACVMKGKKLVCD